MGALEYIDAMDQREQPAEQKCRCGGDLFRNSEPDNNGGRRQGMWTCSKCHRPTIPPPVRIITEVIGPDDEEGGL